jgi:hypothetical protein
MTHHGEATSSRRELLFLGAATGLMRLLGGPGVAYGAVNEDETAHNSLNVRIFGASEPARDLPFASTRVVPVVGPRCHLCPG